MVDTPDTSEILIRLRAALDDAARIHDDAAHSLGGVRSTLFRVMDAACQLDTALSEGAPLPGPWRSKVAVSGGSPGDNQADIALGYLRNAAGAVDAFISATDIKALNEKGVEELAGLAATLSGFVTDLDKLCGGEGVLPTQWLRAHLRSYISSALADYSWQDGTSADIQLQYLRDGIRVSLTEAGRWYAVNTERPPGFWGRIELPGMRHYEGWIAEEERFGMKGAVVRDWDGRETHFVIPGPNSPVLRLPVPATRPPDDGDYYDPDPEPF
jgi:hypothetical protein